VTIQGIHSSGVLRLCAAFSLIIFAANRLCAETPTHPTGKVRTYYVAADEVEWDYAPSGVNKMMGHEFDGYAKIFVERGPHRIGKVYRKAIYREYTDETFTKLKPRTPEWEHLGMLGPVLRAEVGDTIRVVFCNHASQPYSMHPHGVFYDKGSEGAVYADGSKASEKENSIVPPGQTHVYLWQVPDRAGPGPRDPSSIVWLYHSHAEEARDVASGLVGAIVVTARGMADDQGKPKDVDREFVSLFMIVDENRSWYLNHNIETYTSDPKGVDRLEQTSTDQDGMYHDYGAGFVNANQKATINGYIYGNTPGMTMKKGERVRWYLIGMGEFFSIHTPHWHGNVVVQDGKRTDVVALSPAQMVTVDMLADNPGTWMYHCHIDDHMDAGMVALYRVE